MQPEPVIGMPCQTADANDNDLLGLRKCTKHSRLQSCSVHGFMLMGPHVHRHGAPLGMIRAPGVHARRKCQVHRLMRAVQHPADHSNISDDNTCLLSSIFRYPSAWGDGGA